MTTNRLYKLMSDTVRVAIVILAIVALGFSGALAAERAYVETSRAKAAAAEEAKLLPQPAEAASAQGSMAKGSGPCTEQAAIQAPVGITPHNDTRHRSDCVVLSHVHIVDVVAVDDYSPIQSSALVSSRLALQFTLVGAKPSGTM